MQLFAAEFANLVAMFLCGFLGYMSVEWLKWRAAASARHRQKLEGLCEAKESGTAARNMSSSDLAVGDESVKQPNHKQPKPHTERLRNKKATRKARKASQAVAVDDGPTVACKRNMDSSGESGTAIDLDVYRSGESTPTAGYCVADAPQPVVVTCAETAADTVQEHVTALADGSVAGECMTVKVDAEPDDGEAGATSAGKIQEASADNHERPQSWCADAEQLCQQPVLQLHQEPQVQNRQLMAHDKPEVAQQVEEQGEEKGERGMEMEAEEKEETDPEEKNDAEETDKAQGDMDLEELLGDEEELEHGQQEVKLQAAAACDEQCHIPEAESGEWPEWPKTTDGEGSTKDCSSQSQQDVDQLSKEEERRRVLTCNWADAQDEEDWSESGCGTMNRSCFHEPTWPVLQQEAFEHDISKQCSQLDGDTWMTPFASDDCEVPGWFTDDKWFGKGQRGSPGHLENYGDMAKWFCEAEWLSERQSNSCWAENDCWMTPFDELIQRATPHAISTSDAVPSMNSPTGEAVYIWNAGNGAVLEGSGDSSEGEAAAEIFTDGQQVFQPVPSATGQPLFTDGKQLYASVCVVVAPPDQGPNPNFDAACDDAMCGFGQQTCLRDDWSDDEPCCAAVGDAED